MIDALSHDIRHALRGFRRRPLAAGVAVLTLALGIGANVTVFGVVSGVLRGDLPYGDADRLVRIWEHDTNTGRRYGNVTVADFRDWRERSEAFEGLAALRWTSLNLTGEGRAERLSGAAVSTGWFDVLGVQMARGRRFLPEEAAGEAAVAILDHGLWRRRFGGDPDLVGRAVTLNDEPVTVVGVLPPDFRPPIGDPQVWTPSEFRDIREDPGLARRFHLLQVIGRVEEGAAIEGGRAELLSVARVLEAERPAHNEGHLVTVLSLREALVEDIRPALLALMGAVGLVLLIACANLASVSLSRALGRRREFAVRTALGADRRRLLRQSLAEALLVALTGGAAGLLLARWALAALPGLVPPEIDLPQLAGIGGGGRVVLFAAAASVLAGLLFGLAPALLAARTEPAPALRGRGRGTTEGRGGARLRSLLLAGQVALAVLLLGGAGLLGRSLLRLQRVDPGFRTEDLLTFQLSLPDARYGDAESRNGFYRPALERLRGLPGVEAAGATSGLPLWGGATSTPTIEGREAPDPGLEVGYFSVTPGYFETLGIPLLRGRTFGPSDRAGSTPVAIVNERLARSVWGSDDPIGDRIRFSADGPWREIVGVVGDVRQGGLRSEPEPGAYVVNAQDPWSRMHFAVRTAGDPASLAPALRREIGAVDADVPIYGIRTAEEIVGLHTWGNRLATFLLSGFAVAALLLAVLGVYGTVAYAVGRRRRELGVRLALGASPGKLVRGVLATGLAPVLAGALAGAALAAAAGGLLESLLYGVAPRDPAVLLAVPAILAAVAAFAAWLPARRAARVDPVLALREE